MGRLNGKIAIVTGAARGTGAETARLFAAEGAKVCVADIREDEGRAHAATLGDNAFFQALDVRDADAWRATCTAVRERYGPCNVLVNNAAVLSVGPLDELDIATARNILEVNLLGAIQGTQSVLPDMRAAGAGAIVNMGSIDAMEGMGWVAAYCASKFGLRGFTKAAALELGQHGIRVNMVCPAGGNPELAAGIRTNIQARIEAGEKLAIKGLDHGVMGGRHASAREIANVVLFLASDDASYCNGAEYMVDGGHTAGHIWFQTV